MRKQRPRMKETKQDIQIVSGRAGAQTSSLSPSATQTFRAFPASASVGCNLKPRALGSKAKTFSFSPQKIRITPGCQCCSVPSAPHFPPLSSGRPCLRSCTSLLKPVVWFPSHQCTPKQSPCVCPAVLGLCQAPRHARKL